VALIPTFIVGSIALGVFVGGGFLRRQKRGRPETWLYRQLQWRLARYSLALAGHLGGGGLIARSGWWTSRRQKPKPLTTETQRHRGKAKERKTKDSFLVFSVKALCLCVSVVNGFAFYTF
jgi:hypothetical protein